MQKEKKAIQTYLDGLREELVGLSHRIHETPELGFEEFKAAAWQAEILARHGFAVETGYLGLATSYKASVKTGDGPRIAFMAEYDALAGYGHACGHNVIAAASVGAGIGLAHAMKEFGISGEVIVLGTPGEEGPGGKIYLAEHGAFDNVDFALMMHPANENLVGRGGLAAQSLTVTYHGQATHSSAPEKGINALTSVIALFNAIDTLRQVWPDTGRCNGIITKGGSASNIVPDLAECSFTVRASKKKELVAMMAQIRAGAARAAELTGAGIEMSDEPLFAERYSNLSMGELFKVNMESLGEKMNYPDPLKRVGSSDVGNVSMIVPTIHEYLSIAPSNVSGHTNAFREAACAPRADEVVLLAAKGLAMTGFDLATSEESRKAARKEFEEKALPNKC